MTVLTPDEIRAYCELRAIGLPEYPGYPEHLYFQHCSDCRVYVTRFGGDASSAFDMAECLLAPERDNFQGAMIWLTGYHPTFWNCEAAFECVRKGLGAPGPFRQTPGHLFGPDEFERAVMTMGFLMTFNWDATWVPAHGEYLMVVNNDLFIDFAVRGGGGRWDAARSELFDALKLRRWPQMTKRYCPG